MASHALGPFLVTQRVLDDDEQALLVTQAPWFFTMYDPPGPRIVVPARPPRIANRRAPVVFLARRDHATALLPRRTATLPPPGAPYDTISLETFDYGDGAYGESFYGG